MPEITPQTNTNLTEEELARLQYLEEEYGSNMFMLLKEQQELAGLRIKARTNRPVTPTEYFSAPQGTLDVSEQ